MNIWANIILVGSGATALIDLWALARQRLFGVAAPDYALVGRWLGHMPRGQFRHATIRSASTIDGERLIGWSAHYLIGILFAAMLVMFAGSAWFTQPRIGPALIVGIGTVAAPFLLMQPGMGLGVAARLGAKPWTTRAHSLITHVLFGIGLYATAMVLNEFRNF